MTNIGPIDIKITADGVKEAIASFDNLVKRVSDLEKQLTGTAKTEGSKRTSNVKGSLSAQEADYKKLVKEVEGWEKERTRQEKAALAESVKSHKAALAEKARAYKDFGNSVMSSLRGIMSLTLRVGGGLLALGAGFTIADSIKGQMALDRSASLFSANTGVSRQQYINQVNKESVYTNTNSEDISAGMEAFRKSAGQEHAGMALDVIHQANLAAKITGSSIETIMTALGDAAKTIPGITVETENNLTKFLVSMQKVGVGVGAAAEAMPRTLMTARKFGVGTEGTNLAELGVVQALAGKSVPASMLARSFDQIFGNKNAAKLGFDPSTMDVRSLMLKGAALSFADSRKLLGRGADALVPLQTAYQHAGGGSAGAKAAMDLFDNKMRELAEATDLEIKNKEVMNNLEDEWGSTIKAIEIELGQSLLQVLKDHKEDFKTFAKKLGELAVDALPKLLTAITKIVEFLNKFMSDHPTLIKTVADNPVASLIGVMVGGSLLRGLASAAFGAGGRALLGAATGGSTASTGAGAAATSGGLITAGRLAMSTIVGTLIGLIVADDAEGVVKNKLGEHVGVQLSSDINSINGPGDLKQFNENLVSKQAQFDALVAKSQSDPSHFTSEEDQHAQELEEYLRQAKDHAADIQKRFDQAQAASQKMAEDKLKEYQMQKNDPTMGPIYNPHPGGPAHNQHDAEKERLEREKIIKAAQEEHRRVAQAIREAWMNQIQHLNPIGPRGPGGSFSRPGT